MKYMIIKSQIYIILGMYGIIQEAKQDKKLGKELTISLHSILIDFNLKF